MLNQTFAGWREEANNTAPLPILFSGRGRCEVGKYFSHFPSWHLIVSNDGKS